MAEPGGQPRWSSAARNDDFRRRLRAGPPCLLDGATGTELSRRGVDTGLPLWSARALIEAPDVVREIHRCYVAAGAEIVTANTFRTNQRTLAAAGHPGRADELTRRAVELARQAAESAGVAGAAGGSALAAAGRGVQRVGRSHDGAGRGVWVAGSMAPLEDCYSPELVPDDAALAAEHGEMAQRLAAAGVDVLLIETMNTVREAVAAAEAAVATGLPVLVGLVCGRDGRLLSGEPVATAAAVLVDTGVDGILINCSPAPDLHVALAELGRALDDAGPERPATGAYGNVGYADPEQGWINTDSVEPTAYARHAQRWLALGARVVGSCCGTGPAHTAALRRMLDPGVATPKDGDDGPGGGGDVA